MRGEHPYLRTFRNRVCGSAPHARGTRIATTCETRRERVSPACAGNTPSGIVPISVAGSAPHARGTRIASSRRSGVSWVSPACAGNTSAATNSTPPRAGQPRMRGEHLWLSTPALPFAGSAPHARGTHECGWTRRLRRRVSPACAGNTRRPRGRWEAHAGQPRMRGEHSRYGGGATALTASAPHARGTLSERDAVRPALRVSPACAGNTPRADCPSRSAAGQPRMRGEHFVGGKQPVGVRGSAPHARGTQTGNEEQLNSLRVSPACAGNTSIACRHRHAAAGQPRMRGEHKPAMRSS